VTHRANRNETVVPERNPPDGHSRVNNILVVPFIQYENSIGQYADLSMVHTAGYTMLAGVHSPHSAHVSVSLFYDQVQQMKNFLVTVVFID
jgi:hypothetical protein